MVTHIFSIHFNAYSPKILSLVNIFSKLKQTAMFDLISKLKFQINKCKSNNIFVLRSHHGHSQYANEHLGIKV